MLTGKHSVAGFWNKHEDEVYTKMATGYLELENKKQARINVDKALTVNPKNEAALKLKASME